jgi:abortive infection bacteriophage resistance protein
VELAEKKWFPKAPASIPQLLAKLEGRGLAIPDPVQATHHLKFIGYYRLSAYMLPFQHQGAGEDRHQFQPGASMGEILDLYAFDRKLRLLVMDALERTEVAVRAAISDHMSLPYGGLWFQDPKRFKPGFDHPGFLTRLKSEIGHEPRDANRRHVHIRHYYDTYDTPDMPPSWMVFEALPFGVISRTFAYLPDADRKAIAANFRMDDRVLHSVLHALSYLRNLCAHHARIWNRVFTIKPIIPRRLKALNAGNHQFYGLAVLLQDLLTTIVPNPCWSLALSVLLDQHPQVQEAALGFQPDWRGASHWKVPGPRP